MAETHTNIPGARPYPGQVQQIDRIVRLPELIGIVQLSKSTIYDMMNKGQFPKPIQIGERARGWRMSAIQEHIDRRAQAQSETAQ